eukprot:gnl/MRDRNA2_/MRDRNA2_100223_c0_seq1.p1 gnl/MRDRNA2_/MRDRNA2_100223_c0~~gnl/MRDRNA2_/MRDRNA2_100223_c0_seq1.p1  ORF type:complete len:606 (+),score=61.60 gnl/MRDRNA2_/MRDRNA2_100223_c0_seq1:220-1818(+)
MSPERSRAQQYAASVQGFPQRFVSSASFGETTPRARQVTPARREQSANMLLTPVVANAGSRSCTPLPTSRSCTPLQQHPGQMTVVQQFQEGLIDDGRLPSGEASHSFRFAANPFSEVPKTITATPRQVHHTSTPPASNAEVAVAFSAPIAPQFVPGQNGAAIPPMPLSPRYEPTYDHSMSPRYEVTLSRSNSQTVAGPLTSPRQTTRGDPQTPKMTARSTPMTPFYSGPHFNGNHAAMQEAGFHTKSWSNIGAIPDGWRMPLPPSVAQVTISRNNSAQAIVPPASPRTSSAMQGCSVHVTPTYTAPVNGTAQTQRMVQSLSSRTVSPLRTQTSQKSVVHSVSSKSLASSKNLQSTHVKKRQSPTAATKTAITARASIRSSSQEVQSRTSMEGLQSGRGNLTARSVRRSPTAWSAYKSRAVPQAARNPSLSRQVSMQQSMQSMPIPPAVAMVASAPAPAIMIAQPTQPASLQEALQSFRESKRQESPRRRDKGERGTSTPPRYRMGDIDREMFSSFADDRRAGGSRPYGPLQD